jgi:hypothetical protein
MPNTYTELRRTVIETAQPSITFDLAGVSGYTDLVIVASGTYSLSDAILSMRYNADSGTNYSHTSLYGNGTSALSYRGSTDTGIQVGWYPNPGGGSTQANAIIQIMNYSNSTTFKTNISRASTSSVQGTAARVGMWRATPTPITSITLYMSSGNIAVGSTFCLYGIANADQGAAKATGGIITEDSTYWYHTFGASGAFIPKQSLSCDVLVVAGGGGGGCDNGGGGGAGGVRSTTQSLSATNYTVTVGAGGSGSSSATALGTNGQASTFNSFSSSGGGGGSSLQRNPNIGSSGGSGGGGAGTLLVTTGGGAGGAGNSGSYTPVEGFAGGSSSFQLGAPGGGGAGAVGSTQPSGGSGGAGGIGSLAFSSWGLATGTGQNVSGVVYYGGGGGGGSNNVVGGAGGLGGGSKGADFGTQGSVGGGVNTGGGGGGGGGSDSAGAGSQGGSGIVIVRYLKG